MTLDFLTNTRSRRALEAAGIKTMEQALAAGRDAVLGVKYVADATWAEIVEASKVVIPPQFELTRLEVVAGRAEQSARDIAATPLHRTSAGVEDRLAVVERDLAAVIGHLRGRPGAELPR